jgi:hypothetical protein
VREQRIATRAAHAAFGVLFERIDEPGDRMNGGTSHEIFEAVTDPFLNQPGNPLGWLHGDAGHEVCDGNCPNGANPFVANGSSMSGGNDNTLGGACTITGFIPVDPCEATSNRTQRVLTQQQRCHAQRRGC